MVGENESQALTEPDLRMHPLSNTGYLPVPAQAQARRLAKTEKRGKKHTVDCGLCDLRVVWRVGDAH